MTEVIVNYWAILVTGIINVVLGFLWYGPLFGKHWIKLMGWTEEEIKKGMEGMKSEMWWKILVSFIVGLITSWILAHSIIFAGAYLHTSGISSGLMTGFFSWIAFMIPIILNKTLWEGKSWKLFCFDGVYYLVSLLIMGAILASWI